MFFLLLHKKCMLRYKYYVYTPSYVDIGLDKSGYQVNIFFLFLNENICCGYSLEAPRRGASNEYPQHVFIKK